MDPHDCIIHYVDIAKDGIFTATGNFDVGDAIKDAHWEFMRQPVSITPMMVIVSNLMHIQTSSDRKTHDYGPCSSSALQGLSYKCLEQSVWAESINCIWFHILQ